MALFEGEDLVDVTTPDGRTLKLPRTVVPAGMMPPQPPPEPQSGPVDFTDPTVYSSIPEQPVPSVTAGMTIAPDGSVTQPPAPVETPAPPREIPMPKVAVPSTPAEVARANRAYDQKQAKAAKTQAAAQNSPQGQMSGAEAQTQNAIDAQKAAAADMSTVEAAAQDILANAQAEHNAKIDKHLGDQAAAANAAMQAEEAKRVEIDGLRKKIAGTKINRKSDHPIINALGIALANIGAAMNGDKSAPGLELFWRALDRKVAAQMADLDLMEKTYGLEKDSLAALKDTNGRRLETFNTLISGEVDKAKRHLEEIAAKSASDKTRASAKMLIAQLDERGAAAHQDAVRWGLEYNQRAQQHKDQMGLGWFNAKENKRQNIASESLRREEMYLDWQKYLGNVKASGDAEAYKAQLKMSDEVSKRGVRDMNGDLFLTPAGRQQMEAAKQLEDQAAQIEEAGKADPMGFSVKNGAARVAMMREKAAQLRGEAQITGAAVARNDTEAIAVSNMISSGQSVVQLIDGIKQIAAEAGRGALNRTDAQVKLRAMFQQLKPGLKEAWQLGAWDKGSAALVESIIGADPTSEWNAGALGAVLGRKMYEDPKAFMGGLDSVAEDLERKAKNKLVGIGVKFGTKDKVLGRTAAMPVTPEGAASAAISQGQTPVEQANGLRDAGPASFITDRFRFTSREDKADAAEQSGSMKYQGLDTGKQEQGFDTLMKAYKSGDAKAGDALVAKTLAEQARPELATSLAHNLRDYAPDLYVKMRAGLKEGSPLDQQLSYEEKTRIGVAQLDTPMLVQQVLVSRTPDGKVTDQEGFKDLSRRATSGDKDAQRALLDIAQRKSFNDRLPQGSVFKGAQ